MDDAYRNAVAQRNAAQAEIANLKMDLAEAQKRFETAERFIQSWHEFAGVNAPPPTTRVPPSARRKEKPRNPSKEEVAQMAVRVLLSKGRPLSRIELFEALKDEGLVLHGQDPIVVLSTMLWRTKHIVSFVKGTGYWPLGHAIPGRIP
jgi:hypothetical protein